MNTSMEGIDKLLHGLGEIDEILSKIGVFTRMPKLQFEEARESDGFRARQDGLGTPPRSHKIVKKQPVILSTRIDKEKSKSFKAKHKT